MNWHVAGLVTGFGLLICSIIAATDMHLNYFLKWWQVALMWISICICAGALFGWAFSA